MSCGNVAFRVEREESRNLRTEWRSIAGSRPGCGSTNVMAESKILVSRHRGYQRPNFSSTPVAEETGTICTRRSESQSCKRRKDCQYWGAGKNIYEKWRRVLGITKKRNEFVRKAKCFVALKRVTQTFHI